MKFVDVFIDSNPNTPEGCGLRFKAENEPRPVSRVRYSTSPNETIICRVVGWSSEGACPAFAITVEDSGSGTAELVTGGEWGLQLTPENGEPFGEAYLLLAREDLLD